MRERHNDTVIDQHTRQAKGYAELTSRMAEGRRASRAEKLRAKPDDEILDVACGPGALTLELAAHVARATGLDLTPAMLEQARQAQAKSGLTNVDWVEGNAARLPFADACFSLVTCSAAFHHFDNPRGVLAEMIRVCRPGGRVAIMDVTPDSSKAEAYDRMEKMRDPSHSHAHSLSEFRRMGADLGLTDPEVTTSLAGPMPYEAVLATSHPVEHSREELLKMMHQDAVSGDNRLGFRATLEDDTVLVSYPMSTIIWTRT